MCPVGLALNERTMKSAVNKGGPTPILSHIPLPRRKSSSKSDKGLDMDSELGTDSVATKSQAKTSLLGGTSFCCVSGQKEDSLPPPRKRTPNVKQAAPTNPSGKGLLRNRRGRIVEKDWEDAISQSSETGLMKQSLDDIKIRPPDDSRLRPPDLRGRNTPSSPHRKISRDPLPFHKDTSEPKKSSEVVRKLRKDASPRAAAKDVGVARKSRDNGTADNHLPKESCAALLPSGKVSPPKCTQNEIICNAFPLNRETLDTPGHDACHLSGVLPTEEDVRESVVVSVLDGDLDAEKFGDKGLRQQETADSEVTDSEVMKNSHDSDDFDCPCCDRTSALAEGPMSDSEIHVFTSCDVVATPSRDAKATSEGVSDKEEALQGETEALKEELRAERLRLKTHQDRLEHLQTMMGQLKKELQKEKELRQIAEDKFLDVLDHERRAECRRRGSEKRMESKGTQKDSTDVTASENSPLVMGYESRVRRYQTYISKLEKDNLTLVNELKKFKELAFHPPRYQFLASRSESVRVPFGGRQFPPEPLRRSHSEVPLSLQSAGSQEDQAKLLLEKLGEIQRNSHQQQLQYESCLDEVANRLVHTLLVQKRLEEECKVLHLRVEQLEQENGTLMELIDDDKNENMIRAVAEGEIKLESSNSKVQNKLPSQYPTTSSSTKKDSTTREPFILSDERISEPLKVTTACPTKSSEPKSPVSPSSKTGCTSKIPAFGSTKPAAIRKKSKTESQQAKTRNEIHPASPLTVPNIKAPSSIPSSRTKTPLHPDTTKATSVKRKRLSRNGSPAEKGVKESKQRLKTSHTRWEQRGSVPEDLTSLCKSSKGNISPIQGLSRQQQVWSFSCEVDSEIALPESSRKIADSIDAFRDDGRKPSEEVEKQFLNSSEAPASVDGGNRTRDEGYSTMSSDLQPDSAADTNASEPEQSATYIATERELRCVSDDSVTECLDGSMCSSSDSGFGPLHQVANSRTAADLLEEESCGGSETFSSAQDVPHNISTVRHKEQIASVKPTARNNPPPTQLTDRKNKPCIKPKAVCDNFINSEGGSYITQLKQSAEEFIQLSPLKSINILEKLDASLKSSSPPKPPKFRHTSMLGCWNYPKDILDVTSRGETWHLGPKKSCFDDQIVFCSRHSYIDDNIFDDKVETAEKATLTEPEEGHWREKALAPFIDESIWSLYSSEGDIRVKHFPLEPLLSESSLDKLITDCTPCIIVTEDVAQTDLAESLLCKTSMVAGAENFKNGLERVASDTVLYLKDAIHELEDSMHRGLKSSKNISALHNHSGSDSEASPSGLKPELLLNPESVTIGQSRLVWPSPTRSSSTSSLQSSTSIQVVSDEMEDVDLLRSSRKGSQDPDSSGASDVEGENLEHKDFVERWLQNEMASTASKMKVSQLEPVEEAAEPSPSCVRRTSLPLPVRPRPRFLSYPQTSIPVLNFRPDTEKRDDATLGPTCEPNPAAGGTLAEDFEFRGVDSEVKEFNGDFYKLCSIGSLKSLDRFSPAKSQDAQNRQLSESPCINRKTLDVVNMQSNSEKPKPTGLVKPTRPVTLTVRYVPERFQSNRQCRKNPKTTLESDQKGKHTPESHNAVFRKKNSPLLTSLPGSNANDQTSNNRTPKVKAATKIVFKSSASRRRQHSKKDERQNPLKEGCGTAWIHLQANPELTDPMARISLLNSLKAPTSSSGSSSEEDEEEVLVIHTNSHLHRICRERRQKVKASANHPLFDGKKRSSIMGRHELFYRFGAKEKEAMACFDFLEELPTSSVETLNMANGPPSLHRTATPPSDLCPAGREASSTKERISFLSPTASNKSAALVNQSSTSQSPFSSGRRMRLPNLWNQPLSHNMSSSTLNSQDCELLDHISLSDSCAESYSSTPESSS